MTPDQLEVGFFSIYRRLYSDEACTRRMEYFKEIYITIVETQRVNNVHCRVLHRHYPSIKYEP